MRWTAALILALIAVNIGLLSYDVQVATEDTAADWEEGTEWCQEHGGEVYISNSIIHGGFHCELPNGTAYHLDEIPDAH